MKQKPIFINAIQREFILCAIDLKNAVMPLEKEVFTAREFKKQHGISKARMNEAIINLAKQLNNEEE